VNLLQDLQTVYQFHVDNEWTRGQNRGIVREDDGKPVFGYCLIGSILYGLGFLSLEERGLNEEEYRRYAAVKDAMRDELPASLDAELLTFNDTEATGKKDVTDLIKRTIAAELARRGAEIMGGEK
jgi:hypothetical protein